MMPDTYGRVSEAVMRYARALHEGDVATLREIFDPICHLHGLGEGPRTTAEPRDAWLARVATRPSPASQGHIPQAIIRSIDVHGPMATVRLYVAVGTKHFEDSLTLLRLGETWQIVSKTFVDVTPAA